jgi:glucose/arabinose dehydrogenase
MHTFLRRLTLVLICFTAVPAIPASAQGDSFDPDSFAISVEEVTSGFSYPVAIANAGDGTGRLFVVQQTGSILVVEDGTITGTPFLDITDRVGSDGTEQGLLGLAFPPDFTESRLFYVYYTDLDGNNVTSRFTASEDGTTGDPGSEEILISQEDYASNHNGGQLAFGPDGYLYIALGDGGGQGDPNENGQDLSILLGKILRIDVDPANTPEGEAYAIPADNPFVDDPDALPEIWAYGFRNPWRFSFDPETGDLFVGDVGQSSIEEIDLIPAGEGGLNFGWSLMEGEACYAVDPCDGGEAELTLPILQYTHDEGGCSVTGGYVYRGGAIPALQGAYLYADYCSGLIWAGGENTDGTWTASVPVESGLQITSFGVDESGELYLADLTSGTLFRITA